MLLLTINKYTAIFLLSTLLINHYRLKQSQIENSSFLKVNRNRIHMVSLL